MHEASDTAKFAWTWPSRAFNAFGVRGFGSKIKSSNLDFALFALHTFGT